MPLFAETAVSEKKSGQGEEQNIKSELRGNKGRLPGGGDHQALRGRIQYFGMNISFFRELSPKPRGGEERSGKRGYRRKGGEEGLKEEAKKPINKKNALS